MKRPQPKSQPTPAYSAIRENHRCSSKSLHLLPLNALPLISVAKQNWIRRDVHGGEQEYNSVLSIYAFVAVSVHADSESAMTNLC